MFANSALGMGVFYPHTSIIVMAPSPTTEAGVKTEEIVRRLLASEDITAEPGWIAYSLGQRVRIDLVDLLNRTIYEVKTGPAVSHRSKHGLRSDQAERQAALIGKSIGLRNVLTRDKVARFRVRSVIWVSVAVQEGRLWA